jgi:linoleoyl-CoA desaturase
MQVLPIDRPSKQSPGARFAPRRSFHADLKRRVDAYFEGSGRSRHGGLLMGLKSVAILSWLAGSYALLLFADLRAWQAILLSLSVGFAMAGVGFSVMHDANHGGTSSRGRVNRILSMSLDLIGASSFLWRSKHNVLHHGYTNISKMDPDLEGGWGVLRLAPWQPRRAVHRFQHLYVWFLYGVFPLKWWFIDDFKELATGRINGHQFPRARWPTLLAALAGKALFVTWTLVIPSLLHPWWAVAGLFAITVFVLGNLLATVFQLAHCVDEAEFIATDSTERDWTEHQIATTVDFAPDNPLLSWYLGGLNFQVEHHLFPRVCHLHHRALARIVEETCRAHGVRYRSEPTLRSALASNWRWLRRMGSPERRDSRDCQPAPPVVAARPFQGAGPWQSNGR